MTNNDPTELFLVTSTNISFTSATVIHDEAGYLDTSTNTIAARDAGWYDIFVHVRMAAAGGTVLLHVTNTSSADLGSVQVANDATDGIRINLYFPYRLAAGQQIIPVIYQDSGAAINLTTATIAMIYRGY